MPDELNSSFPFTGLRVAGRPKGAHLYRVFSMTNRAPMTLFYHGQLVAWTNLEFDRRVISYQAINRWYDGDDFSLFVAFYVRFMERDHFIYIPDERRPEAAQAFEKYAKGLNVVATPIAQLDKPQDEVEFWNKIKMMCVITRFRDKLTARNLTQFSRSLHVRELTIEELECSQEYPESEALAYAFEMVRIGSFSLSKMKDELLNGYSVISLKRSM